MEKLITYLNRSHSPYHAVEYSKELLKEAGFEELKLDECWKIDKGGKYYVDCYLSSLYAFTVGEEPYGMLRLAAAHTDYPCFRIKPDAVIKSGGAVKLNIEPYGGGIYSTWLDRALSMAGIVCVKGENAFDVKEILFDFGKPVMIIPNLAIHMNREVNKGVELNAFNDMMPVCALDGSHITNDLLVEKIAENIGCNKDDIISYDLCAYATEEAKIVGLNDEFILSQGLDNITSVSACMHGLIASERKEGINLIALYDHEEIGSKTKQGADGALNTFIIEKICMSLGFTREEYLNTLMGGMLLSCDVAHGVHPNKVSVTDPTVNAKLGGGVVIKMNYNQKYPTDPKSVGIIYSLCEENGISYQKFMNRADKAGGSTIGALASSNMAMRAVDIGVPMLAMHSAGESMAIKDQESITNLVAAYLKA